jgi:hypothetical protein
VSQSVWQGRWFSAVTSVVREPRYVVMLFYGGGLLALVSAMIPASLPPNLMGISWTVLALGCAVFTLQAVARRRRPMWAIHVELVIATILVSVGAAIGVRAGINLAVLYIGVAIFGALYFSLPAALAQLAYAAV